MKYAFFSLLIALALLVQSCNFTNKKIDGGYDFVANIPDTDTNLYKYPVRDKITGKDSVWQNFEWEYYKVFNEPNISLKAADENIFRFNYSEAMSIKSIIITLSKDKIIVKEALEGAARVYEYDDSLTLLSKEEKTHYNIISTRFPLQKYLLKSDTWIPAKKHYYDSLVKAAPQVLDPKYYKKLIEKILYKKSTDTFNYSTSIIPITKKEYNTIVDSINASGYWKLPIYLPEIREATTAHGYSLEANAYGKYNLVTGSSNTITISPFAKALQMLIDKAQLKAKIQTFYEPKD